MNDLEITKKCAEKMGLTFRSDMSHGENWIMTKEDGFYNPLGDDAQAMALVKKFALGLAFSGRWSVYEQGDGAAAHNVYLNRAICECVANMSTASPPVR